MTQAPAATRSITQLRKQEDDDVHMRPLSMALIVRMFRYTKPYATRRNWLFVLTALRAAQLPSIWAIIVWTVEQAINKGDMNKTMWGTGAFAALALFTQVCFHFRQRLALELGEAVIHDLRRDIFGHLQRLTMGFYGRGKTGRIYSRMISDVEAMRVGVSEVLFISIVQAGQMIVAAAYMLYYDRLLFGLLMLIAPVVYLITRHFRKKLSKAYRQIQESFSRITATLVESVSGIRVTQGFVRQDVNAELFAELVEDHSEYNMAERRTTGVFLPMLELNNQVFIALLLIVGTWHTLGAEAGSVEQGTRLAAMVGFFLMANQFFGPVGALGQVYNQALTAMAGAERVFKFLDTPPDWSDPSEAVTPVRLEGKVEFGEIGFEYVPGKAVLIDVNFTAQPGQTVALVGHTGSGKTTVINLIAKFYLPTRGRLLIDGRDITTLDTDWLHHQMGIVLQTNFLFTGTVMDNIRVGKPEATDAQVMEAARGLDVLDLIETLPEGFNTSVGERGGNMSLGQRQIICFCRAMLADPRIIILDEATSSVDAITEARVQKALSMLLKGRTSFVVAHRLSTIRQADVILVLDHGRIVERGTHMQLLATGGVYAQLYRRFIRASKE